MYLGRRQLGQEVSFPVASTVGDPGSASWPSSPPVLDIWKGTTLVLSGKQMPKVDGAAISLFRIGVFLDGRFSVGNYEAVVRWVNGTYMGVSIHNFEVVDGGDVRGAVVSLFHHEMPHARFLVLQTDAGLIQRGKNPSI